MRETDPQFLSTAQAAEMLGLSTTLIQSLVDRNELSGWKTRGGHRRISRQSILDYQTNAQVGSGLGGKPRGQATVMVVAESQDLFDQLQSASQSWRFPFVLQLRDAITAALLDLSNARPDMLVVELAMPLSQQERTVAALQEFNARGRPMSIALVTQETGLLTGKLSTPSSIQLVPGPMTPDCAKPTPPRGCLRWCSTTARH